MRPRIWNAEAPTINNRFAYRQILQSAFGALDLNVALVLIRDYSEDVVWILIRVLRGCIVQPLTRQISCSIVSNPVRSGTDTSIVTFIGAPVCPRSAPQP